MPANNRLSDNPVKTLLVTLLVAEVNTSLL
jgi:hypothetical protein